jgi:acetyl esterase/lipase
MRPSLSGPPRRLATRWTAPEKDTTKPTDNLIAGKPLIRLGNVSTPTLTFYPRARRTQWRRYRRRLPGGGYNILALDLEGSEVCEWLNTLGVNCALVKYRVPVRAGLPRHAPPLQDSQRAVGRVRAAPPNGTSTPGASASSASPPADTSPPC